MQHKANICATYFSLWVCACVCVCRAKLCCSRRHSPWMCSAARPPPHKYRCQGKSCANNLQLLMSRGRAASSWSSGATSAEAKHVYIECGTVSLLDSLNRIRAKFASCGRCALSWALFQLPQQVLQKCASFCAHFYAASRCIHKPFGKGEQLWAAACQPDEQEVVQLLCQFPNCM